MTDNDFIFTFPVSIGLVWDSDRPETSTITDVCRCIGTTILLQDVSSISLYYMYSFNYVVKTWLMKCYKVYTLSLDFFIIFSFSINVLKAYDI